MFDGPWPVRLLLSRMKILTVHGLGHQEKNPGSWQPMWQDALREVLTRWNASLNVDVAHALYDDFFADTPMTVGGTASGFGRLLWNEIKYSIGDTVTSWFRRRGFGEEVSETVKWKVGMVTQFADDEGTSSKVENPHCRADRRA
jgi:hypothetical protein